MAQLLSLEEAAEYLDVTVEEVRNGLPRTNGVTPSPRVLRTDSGSHMSFAKADLSRYKTFKEKFGID